MTEFWWELHVGFDWKSMRAYHIKQGVMHHNDNKVKKVLRFLWKETKSKANLDESKESNFKACRDLCMEIIKS